MGILNDHDELRHDPMMAVLAGKLEARREDCAPVAGESTLNRLELSKLEPTRCRKISHDPVAIKNLWSTCSLRRTRELQSRSFSTSMRRTTLHGQQEGRSPPQLAAHCVLENARAGV